MSRVALLSNVNMNPVIRLLGNEAKKSPNLEIYQPEGYGNELGLLLNPASTFHQFEATETFLIVDICELVGHATEPEEQRERITEWFSQVEAAILTDTKGSYFISDGLARGPEYLFTTEPFGEAMLEQCWNEVLGELVLKCSNVRVFPYRKLIGQIGEAAFSDKTWYMGKIPHTMDAQKRMAAEILETTRREEQAGAQKKVLVLDLDNTLWGKLAGENDQTPVELSDDHAGLAYKNLQRVILAMKLSGVLLAIASKNNPADAMEIIEKHPHMILKKSDFAAIETCWDPKPVMLERIAKKLNLGLASFVFFDDNPVEREAVACALPEVTVADFPEQTEQLPVAMARIGRTYFLKNHYTAEDFTKTESYAANEKREALLSSSVSFEEYLKGLNTEIIPEDAGQNRERLLQLLNKTNQFNLTTKRHTPEDLDEILTDASQNIYFYRVKDRFGDNGLVAAVVVLWEKEVAVIEEFVMSCRVMGRRIENTIVSELAKEARLRGKTRLRGLYIETAKNLPVKNLYRDLGFEETGEEGVFEWDIL